jgi:hypothetical protein
MLAHPVVAAVSDRRRRSEIDATIYVPPYNAATGGSTREFHGPLACGEGGPRRCFHQPGRDRQREGAAISAGLNSLRKDLTMLLS